MCSLHARSAQYTRSRQSVYCVTRCGKTRCGKEWVDSAGRGRAREASGRWMGLKMGRISGLFYMQIPLIALLNYLHTSPELVTLVSIFP